MAEVTAVYDALPAPRAAEDIIIGGRRCRLEPQVPVRFFALAVADDGHCVCDYVTTLEPFAAVLSASPK